MEKIAKILIVISVFILLSSIASASVVVGLKTGDLEGSSSFQTNSITKPDQLFPNDVVFENSDIVLEDLFVENGNILSVQV